MGVSMRIVSGMRRLSNFWAGGSRVNAGQRVLIAVLAAVFLLQILLHSGNEPEEICLNFPQHHVGQQHVRHFSLASAYS